MNLLCPNCQKMLTVPEQYAGQLMKCPLCAGTFNARRGDTVLADLPGPVRSAGPGADQPDHGLGARIGPSSAFVQRTRLLHHGYAAAVASRWADHVLDLVQT